MSRRLQNTQRTGWYYRVLKPGQVHRGDKLSLEQRPHPGWPLSRVLWILYESTLDQGALASMAKLEALSLNLRQLVSKRLETGQVEGWETRLYGPAAG